MTKLQNKIVNMFPKSWDDVPVDQHPVVIEQTYYLGANGITPHIKRGKYIEVFSPVSVGGKPVRLGKYPQMNKKQVFEIIDAQTKAWDDGNGEWPMMGHTKRCDIIRKCLEDLKATREKVVNLIMWETGKTRKLSEAEFDRTIEYMFNTCDEFEKLIEKWNLSDKKGPLSFELMYNAAGRVLAMGPSNYPMNETLQIVIPLLLTGNVVALKHAKAGVLMLEPIIQVFAKHLPNGVLTTVYGDGKKVVPYRVRHNSLEYFAFIGGAYAADAISRKIKNPHQVGSFKGLNAKNPIFILKGADIDMAVKLTMDSAIENNNAARCTATKKCYVAPEIYDEFVVKCIERANKIKFGMPWEDVTNTPLLPGSVPWMQKLIADAVGKGAKIVNECGGMRNEEYIHPVVLVDVTEDMLIAKEEQFCPILPIFKMEETGGLDAALQWVKKCDYGQQLSIIASESVDYQEVRYIVHKVQNQVCQVNINATGKRYDDKPFSGRRGSGQDSISLIEAIMLATFPFLVVTHESYYNN